MYPSICVTAADLGVIAPAQTSWSMSRFDVIVENGLFQISLPTAINMTSSADEFPYNILFSFCHCPLLSEQSTLSFSSSLLAFGTLIMCCATVSVLMSRKSSRIMKGLLS
jgi:hypothetical protein